MALESIEKLREMLRVCGCDPDECMACSVPREVKDGLADVEAEIDERFIELPVDADGIAWSVNDNMFAGRNESAQRTLTAIRFLFDEGRWLLEDERCCTFYADECRHVKPDPVKELLRQYRNELEELIQGGFGNVDSFTDDFAARIREAVEK